MCPTVCFSKFFGQSLYGFWPIQDDNFNHKVSREVMKVPNFKFQS